MSSANSTANSSQPKRGLEPNEDAAAPPDAKKQALSSTEKICSQCKMTKSKLEDFYKKQRTKADGQCKECWDDRGTMEQGLDASVTIVCSDCKVRKSQVKFSKLQRKAADATCIPCTTKQRQKEAARQNILEKERLLKEKSMFYLNFGIGYHLNRSFLHGGGDSDPPGKGGTVNMNPDSMSLVGDYEVIYCYSESDNGRRGWRMTRRIARTARGSVRLRSTHWDAEGTKPALCGQYATQAAR